MTEHYQEKLKQGLEYQDFVFDQLRHMDGMPVFLGAYASKKYQYEKGESSSGLEIKYDSRFHETGNLFIEYQEKSDPSNEIFIASGIMRDDNTWLYFIGDYEQAFIFAKKTLRSYCLTYQEQLQKRPVPEGTSWGYLLPVKNVLTNNFLVAKHILFRK